VILEGEGNMASWLYNSSGRPIAFVSDDKVFSRSGLFMGRLDGNEVWHGSYKGEIVKGDRFLYKTNKGSVIRGTPGVPGTPGIPGLPGAKGSIALPAGYRDVEIHE
jgi:hypothetical protein